MIKYLMQIDHISIIKCLERCRTAGADFRKMIEVGAFVGKVLV